MNIRLISLISKPQPRIRSAAEFSCCVVAFVMKSDFKEMGEVIPRSGTQKTAGFLPGFTTMNEFHSFTLPFPRFQAIFLHSIKVVACCAEPLQ